MTATSQLRVVVVQCAATEAELCADALVSIGAFAVEERLHGDRVELRTSIDDELVFVRRTLSAFDVDISEEWISRDVLDTWKEFATPTFIDEGCTIVPSWLAEGYGADDSNLIIDPEESFGIGDHPTTQLCARWLLGEDLKGVRILDAGCGTGVLSVIAARCGANVVAVDIAENALGATGRNAARNTLTLEKICRWEDLGSDEDFDVIVANILAPVLIDLAPLLTSLLRPGGRIVMAGVRIEQVSRVIEVYSSLTIASRGEFDGWALIELQAP